MSTHFFSLAEARAALPRVKKQLKGAMAISVRMHEFAPHLEELADKSDLDSGSPLGVLYLDLLLALKKTISSIEDTGCLVKSVEEGLIDFPHFKNGREVYLCWKYGEDDINYWHETDAGFAGRMPIVHDDRH